MVEDGATPDLVALTRLAFEATDTAARPGVAAV